MQAVCILQNLAPSEALGKRQSFFSDGRVNLYHASAAQVAALRRAGSCVRIIPSKLDGRARVSEHISRKELKQDKIKETIEHGAEAVISHGQFTLIVVIVILAVALGYGGWGFYFDCPTVVASVGFDVARRGYQGRIATVPHPAHSKPPFF